MKTASILTVYSKKYEAARQAVPDVRQEKHRCGIMMNKNPGRFGRNTKSFYMSFYGPGAADTKAVIFLNILFIAALLYCSIYRYVMYCLRFWLIM